MSESIVFPPIIGFILIASNLLLLCFLLYVLLEKQNRLTKQEKDISEEESLYIETLTTKYGYGIIEKSILLFSNTADFDSFLGHINKAFMHITQADGGIILLSDKINDVLKTKAYDGYFIPPIQLPSKLLKTQESIANYFYSTEFNYTDTVFGTIVKNKKAEIITQMNDKRIFINESKIAKYANNIETSSILAEPSSYIFIPLIYNSESVGLVVLCKKRSSGVFSVSNFDSTKLLLSYVTISLKNIFTFEEVCEKKNTTLKIKTAKELQQKIYCTKNPFIQTLELASFFSESEVCSDYYDVISARKDRVCFVLAEALKSGMNAVMITSMIRSILRLVSNTTHSSSTLLKWLNMSITYDKTLDTFVKIALLLYNPQTKTVQCSVAGENPILFYNSLHKTWKLLGENKEPLGFSKNTEFYEIEQKINENDIIVLFTDGLVDATNELGISYTIERLKKNIENCVNLSSKEIAERIKRDIIEYTKSTSTTDDASFVILKGTKNK